MPIVTTLHTILREPDAHQRRVLIEVAGLSDRLVVMSKRGAEFLQEIYHVAPEKIDLIPHGIPDLPFVDPSFHKDLFGVEGKTVLLSFGLLSANKGIENVIAALPAILAKHPNVVYFIVGATHPHVLRHDGETYRFSLQWLAQEKGVEGQVIFYNRFVSLEELVEFIGAADIYITPYLNPAQIVSGTLAYTVGAGKAVISTPYWHAEEMLAEERGVLVPFRDPAALAEQVIDLLDNEAKRHAMRKRAYLYGREMIWPQVARRYMESFQRARAERRHFTPPGFVVKALDKRPAELPPLKLDHLRRMTDDTGMFQHAIFTLPNYHEGYTIDDNARALTVSTLLEELGSEETADLMSRYLAFVWYAFNAKTGRFRNFMSYQRHWLEEIGSDDSHGRALWALGTVLGRSNTPGVAKYGRLGVRKIIACRARHHQSAGMGLRAHRHQRISAAFCRRPDDRPGPRSIGRRLVELYRHNRTDDWRWYEDSLTYCNAVLPHALLTCGQTIANNDMTAAGLESLGWLADLQRAGVTGGHFVPIGSNGFYQRGGARARFDQQPVEAQAMVSACLQAHRITGDKSWYKEARCAFDWFLGRNDLNLPIYDPTTGGCRDGLHPDRPNENQGAESSLAFLQAMLELRLAETTLASVETGV